MSKAWWFVRFVSPITLTHPVMAETAILPRTSRPRTLAP
jgi:hypothetical protein